MASWVSDGSHKELIPANTSRYFLIYVVLPLKFPINTMRTAQYAAVAAKSSARFAFVRRPIDTANSKEKTIKSPMLRNVLERLLSHVIRYMMNTGTARRKMMMSTTTTIAIFSILPTCI
jgi:hypothetical protein